MNVQVNPAINTFTDLIFVLNNQPEWRRQLAEALFPDFNIHKTLESLAETNRLLREDITLIQARLDKMDQRFDKIDQRFDKIDQRFDKIDQRLDKIDQRFDRVEGRLDNLEDSVGDMQDSMARLKGKSYEGEVISKINSVLGRFARRGRDARNEICNSLDEMEDAGTISTEEYGNVVSADLFWQGVLHKSKKAFYVVGEVSWLAELRDVERASQRAQIVQKAGLHAVPLVAGEKWTYEAIEAAKESSVVRVRQLSVEKESWLPALEYVSNGSDSERS